MTAPHAIDPKLTHPEKPEVEVAIVGTGFAGLCMAIKLAEDGVEDVVLLERSTKVGGTWRDNDYPGAACDVPSHLYSLSFEPNSEWSRKYPTQPELLAYLEGVAKKHGLLSRIRFQHNVVGAAYDDAAKLWRVETSKGPITARTLILGNGGLAEPKNPDISGIERFGGQIFHSARWDHSADLRGKRVAVIGTGASAIQFVPEIAPKVGRLDVYQRTPNWLIPRLDRPYTELEKRAFRSVPGVRRLHRNAIYWGHEARVMGFVIHPALMKVFQNIAELHLKRQVPDAALRARLTPDYTIGCRRVLISNDWYPTMRRPNVDLITSPIREITETGVITADGSHREVDTIILGTGFYATENPIAQLVTGRGGLRLSDAWREGEEAYLGTMTKGFPNLYFIVGPNTGLGHSSMVFIIESQVRLIRQLLAHVRSAGAKSVEVRHDVHDAYNRKLQARLGGSIWATGCDSWYKHRSGKITALWPGFTFEFFLKTKNLEPSDYVLDAVPVPA